MNFAHIHPLLIPSSSPYWSSPQHSLNFTDSFLFLFYFKSSWLHSAVHMQVGGILSVECCYLDSHQLLIAPPLMWDLAGIFAGLILGRSCTGNPSCWSWCVWQPWHVQEPIFHSSPHPSALTFLLPTLLWWSLSLGWRRLSLSITYLWHFDKTRESVLTTSHSQKKPKSRAAQIYGLRIMVSSWLVFPLVSVEWLSLSD